jgi:hypothetical protein
VRRRTTSFDELSDELLATFDFELTEHDKRFPSGHYTPLMHLGRSPGIAA